MHLTKLSLVQFRNYIEQQVLFSPHLNLIFGSNGQGKTNLIEAIYVLAFSKSFRTHLPTDLIHRDFQQFHLMGNILAGGREIVLTLEQDRSKKVLQANSVKQDVFTYVQHFPLIAFSSIHLEQFKSESEQRRRLIDRGLCQLQPVHLRRLSDYYRVLKQKNSLLRQAPSVYNTESIELIEVWNLQLAELGAKIIESRNTYISKIKEKLARPSQRLAPEISDIYYVACNEVTPNSLSDIREQVHRKLKENREREIRSGRSLVGPHRDEVVIEINGKSARRYASAGQLRSSLINYYLAQMELAFERLGEYPAFLIDDVDSELDGVRINQLLEILRNKAQIFVTTTKPELIRLSCPAECVWRLHVEEGHVRQVSSAMH
jgi:DNA replication and repair protein RecF